VILSSASFGEDVSETEAGLCRARIKERIGMKMGKKEVLREERRKKREMGVTEDFKWGKITYCHSN